MEFSEKECAKSSALETNVIAVLPLILTSGRKDDKIKLLEIFLTTCQKSLEEL